MAARLPVSKALVRDRLSCPRSGISDVKGRALIGLSVLVASGVWPHEARGQAGTSPGASAPSDSTVTSAEPSSAAPAPSTEGATPTVEASGDVRLQVGTGGAPAEGAPIDDGMPRPIEARVAERTGFEAGLRAGFSLPIGGAGQTAPGVLEEVAITDRDLKDLTPWQAPVWVDVGYRVTPSTTIGAYVQLGVGASGDDCAGDCDWSDIHIGAEVQWRARGGGLEPWLGLGAGWESLTFRTFAQSPEGLPLRFSERLAGPEAILQGGLDFEIDESLGVGPYVSAAVGQYTSDVFKCEFGDALPCPDVSLEGSGFHSWLGIGLRGTYLP